MTFSILLLKKIITLALMILMGFSSVKSGRLKGRDSEVISQLCFDWVIPLSLVNSFLIDYTPEVARDFRFSCLITVAAVLFFVGLTRLLAKPFGLNPSEQGTLMFTNSAGITLPLASALMGSTGVLLCAPHMATQNFLIFTVLQRIMSGREKMNWRRILLGRNIIAIAVGLLLFLTQLPVPEILRETISGVSAMMGPLSMFMIGMLMGEVDFRALLARRELYRICALRLFGYPGIAILLTALSGVTRRLPYTRDILLVLVMCISAPAAALVTQMASVHRGMEEAKLAGSLNVITSLLCVITIPVMMFFYQILC